LSLYEGVSEKLKIPDDNGRILKFEMSIRREKQNWMFAGNFSEMRGIKSISCRVFIMLHRNYRLEALHDEK
jgi:hypothetical protein